MWSAVRGTTGIRGLAFPPAHEDSMAGEADVLEKLGNARRTVNHYVSFTTPLSIAEKRERASMVRALSSSSSRRARPKSPAVRS